MEDSINMVVLIGIGIVLAIFSWGILWHNSSILFETLYRGDRSKKRVALTFDDGPDPNFTHQVLDILRTYNARATFFCVGRLAEMYPDIVERIHMEGHLVANHSYEHSWPMYLWPPSKVRSSIVKTGNILERITGVFPRFYRPPVGIKTPPQIFTVWRMGLRFVGWTLWALDGGQRTLTMEKTRSLVDKTRNGDIFLLHDGKLNVDGRVVKNETHGAAIAECLPVLIKGLQARGYELVPLDKLFGLPGSLETPVDALETGPAANLRGLFKGLYHTMLHEYVSPFKLSLALLIGIIIGCSPFFGFHALIGIIAAARLRLNKLITIAGTNISNPLTGPFVIIASIKVGGRILYGSWLTPGVNEVRTQSIWNLGNRLLASWLVGFPLVGAAAGLAVIGLFYPLFWIWQSRRAVK